MKKLLYILLFLIPIFAFGQKAPAPTTTTKTFTDSEIQQVKTGLILTEKENLVLSKTLSGIKPVGMAEAKAQIAAYRKMYVATKINVADVKYLYFSGQKKTVGDMTMYLSRKKLNEK